MWGDNRDMDRGFTLVELLLVLVLLGVLAAVALPSYQTYRNRVRTAQAVTDVAAMAAIIQTYANDAHAYPDSLADVKLNGKTDPWGQAYVYYNVEANGKGGARKDKALNPINSDFDLYSVGPDGASKAQVTQKSSLDDVIRASNGKFVGVAADF